jgi:hypothetical protein
MDDTSAYVNGCDLCLCDAGVEWMRLLCMTVYIYIYIITCICVIFQFKIGVKLKWGCVEPPV